MLRDVVGLDQVLFGSDFPYIRRDLGVNCVQQLERTSELTGDERARVMSGNAMKLFPRLGALASKRSAS
jgi:aminocarboxymuconate-semialdehyde decarboxylase